MQAPFVAIVNKLQRNSPDTLKVGARVLVHRTGTKFGGFGLFDHNGKSVILGLKNMTVVPHDELTAKEKKALTTAVKDREAAQEWIKVNAKQERLSDSGKAWLLNFSGAKKWIPASAMKIDGDTVLIAKWFAEKNQIGEHKPEPVNAEKLIADLAATVGDDDKKARILELLKQLV